MKEYFAFQWHITDECDQRCKHCYIFSENNCKHLDAMTWEQIQETFYNCMDFCEVYGRLRDRGSLSSVPIVANAQDFLCRVAAGLGLPVAEKYDKINR